MKLFSRQIKPAKSLSRKTFGAIICACCYLLVNSGASAQAVPAVTPPILKPGDILRVQIWKNPELSGDLLISEEGFLVHPVLRTISVVGVPLPEVESRLRAFLLKSETDPQFVLQPLIRVFVGGAVGTPNLYRWGPETTLAQAIWLAGGPVERANLSRVHLWRDGQETLIDATRATSPAALTPVRSGDQILVDRKSRSWREYLGTVGSLASMVILFLRIRDKA
jgi:protein involved in polysaccharide export with SLBB domain